MTDTASITTSSNALTAFVKSDKEFKVKVRELLTKLKTHLTPNLCQTISNDLGGVKDNLKRIQDELADAKNTIETCTGDKTALATEVKAIKEAIDVVQRTISSLPKDNVTLEALVRDVGAQLDTVLSTNRPPSGGPGQGGIAAPIAPARVVQQASVAGLGDAAVISSGISTRLPQGPTGAAQPVKYIGPPARDQVQAMGLASTAPKLGGSMPGLPPNQPPNQPPNISGRKRGREESATAPDATGDLKRRRIVRANTANIYHPSAPAPAEGGSRRNGRHSRDTRHTRRAGRRHTKSNRSHSRRTKSKSRGGYRWRK